MKKYKYVAMNLKRQKLSGLFLADSENELRLKLAEQGLYLISADVSSEKSPNAFLTLTGKISIDELTTFCRQFSIMINAGIPVVEVFDILKRQAFSGFFKKILDMIHEDIKSGVSLAKALEKHKKIFPDFFRSMIYVGEVSGKLDHVLDSLADYYERDYKINKKTKSALTYPCVLIVMAVGIIFLIVLFVVPRFTAVLQQLEIEEMPVLTQVIMDFSEWMKANWYYLVLVVGFVFLTIKIVSSYPKGKYFFDSIIMHLPLIKDINTDLISAKFARSFSLLVSSGMDVVDSLDVIKKVLGNAYVERKFSEAVDDIRQGMSLAVAFETHEIFPPMMLQMLMVGEKTGAVESVVGDSCAFFDDNAERKIDSIVSLIQPVILCIIGGCVGVLFIAIYSPMLSVMNKF